jgi:hypothetical protein
MKLPNRRRFLHLAAGAAALPATSRIAWAQTYPVRPVLLLAEQIELLDRQGSSRRDEDTSN